MTSSYNTTVHRNYIQVNSYGNKTYHGRLKDGIKYHTLHKVFKTATMAERYAWAVSDRLVKLRKAQREYQEWLAEVSEENEAYLAQEYNEVEDNAMLDEYDFSDGVRGKYVESGE